MSDAEMSADEERHPENPLNNEEENLRDGEIWVDLKNNQVKVRTTQNCERT